MEENKTTRVNRTVNYYSDRPDYDRHMEKHNCHCERPHYDHCPEKPEYDRYPERPHYDHCPERPEYDHYPERPHYDHYPVKPEYDHHPVRPNYDHYPAKPDYDHHPVRPNHDCHDEKPKHECCEDKPNCDFCSEIQKPSCFCCPVNQPQKPNGCTKCCNPENFIKCPDISCAVCTPILTDKIHAFKCIKKEINSSTTLQFFIDQRDGVTYPPDTSVCIEKIDVVYSCLGFTNNTLPINLCSVAGSLPSIPSTCTADTTPLYTSYEGTLTSNFLCCDKGVNATLAHSNLNFGIADIQYIVSGFIGCEPFTARSPQTPIDSPDNGCPYSDINLFTHFCVPKSRGQLTLRANFELKFEVNQITPTSTVIGTNTFTADVFNQLSIRENFFIITPSELVVFSAPNGFECCEK